MAHVGTLRDYRFQGDTDDIRGSNVYGRDNEKLGEINDVIFDHHSGEIRYVVVDTGGWLSSKKFIVPADRLESTDQDDRYHVDLTKEQIENFPPYDEKVHEEQGRWDDYEGRYSKNWTETGGVLHREGSTNILIPDASELPPTSSAGGADVTPTRLAPTFTDPAPSSDKLRMRPEGTASRAEDTRFPGTAHNTESADWEKPESAIDREREESGIPRSRELRDREVISRDTGRGISNADLTEDTTEFSGDQSAYGDIRRSVAPEIEGSDPASYRQRVGDPSDDLARPYPVQQGRNERWRSFEENLRRNRVDITSSCRSCSPAREDDKAA